jgi:methionine synthase II (cobalamin-independent)
VKKNHEEIRDRVLEAVRYIPEEELGGTDDCGFSPFLRRRAESRSRDEGTLMEQEVINGK